MPSSRAVGPLDKRRNLTRCVHCAQRRIKCESRFPCRQCISRDIPCEPQQQKRNTVAIFVQTTQPNGSRGDSIGSDQRTGDFPANEQSTTIALLKSMPVDQNTRFLGQFVVFVEKNALTMSFPLILPDLLSLLPTSAVMHHAATALGALEAIRFSPKTIVPGQISPQIAAIRAYQTALAALQPCLGETNVAERDDVLWTTIFLGLFELLSDKSGDGWIKHMLYGTSKMLQLAGPSMVKSRLRRGFLDLFRVLEASRSLLYHEETILSQECWIELQKNLCSTKDIPWQPMDGILNLMIETSAFNLRSGAMMESIPESERHTDPSMTLIAAEGLIIQSSLYNWHTEALLYLSQNVTDDYFSLSLFYYHALIIFLSGNYDYYPYWDNIPAPILSPDEVADHVNAILDIAEQLVSRSRLPGVMLFFPFIVAGNRVRRDDHRTKLLSLIDRIINDGVVVAHRVRDNMVARWMKVDRSLVK
ncbi:hypothetical protein BJX99DRAFT_267174, partial [Aspergillus californicus]